MKKFYMTNRARKSAIDEITRLIGILMLTTTNELDYFDCRSIIRNLCDLRTAIEDEAIEASLEEAFEDDITF